MLLSHMFCYILCGIVVCLSFTFLYNHGIVNLFSINQSVASDIFRPSLGTVSYPAHEKMPIIIS